MITGHQKGTLSLYDGERTHSVRHDAFVPMRPHKDGGIHPGVTEECEGWLAFPAERDMTGCPVEPVMVEHIHPASGKPFKMAYLPIVAWLQAEYGPDKQIASIPINGDSNAQHLHWLHRDEKGRAEMRAVLEWMGAWRLKDDGSVATDEELRAIREARFHAEAEAQRLAEEEIDPPPKPQRRRLLRKG